MNERRNAETLAEVISFVEDAGGETLHADALFMARYGHPALFSHLGSAYASGLAELVGVAGRETNKTRLSHVAAQNHQHDLLMLLVEVNADPHAKNENDQTVLDFGKASQNKDLRLWAETYGLFLDQYSLTDTSKHNSGTCLLAFAEDVLNDSEDIALKFMCNKDEWLREQDMRKLPDGTLLDGKHVVQLLAKKELNEGAGTIDPRLQGHGDYRFMLVMPQASRDLSDAMSHDRLAGYDQARVVNILFQVVVHLKYLNEDCDRTHGDIKPRNVVQMLIDGEMAWVLIDLDASCKIGWEAGQKVTSSAYFAPEMARQYLSLSDSSSEATTPQIKASVQLEMWNFGVMMYQLCTKDGATLWHSDQADNIDDAQLRQLALNWSEIRAVKLKRVVWPKAAHLIDWLLQENPAHRPQSWDQVMLHPFLAGQRGSVVHKRVVMSCPEMGTLDEDGGVARIAEGADATEVYNQDVMKKVSELQQIGFVKFGFDRAGTSTAVETEEEKKKWSKAFDGTLAVAAVGDAMRLLGLELSEMQLQNMIDEVDTDGLKIKSDSGGEMTILAGTIDFPDFCTVARKTNDALTEDDLKKGFRKFAQATAEDVKEMIFKSTEWWYGYQTSVKQAVKLESQGFGGVLDVICIRGGPITRLEAAEMAGIMEQAIGDCAKSGISVQYEISYVSYRDFLLEYEPWCVEDELERAPEEQRDEPAESNDGEPMQTHGDTENLAEGVAVSSDVVLGGSGRDRVKSATEVVSEVKDLRDALDRKDEELVAKDREHAAELAAKDRELAAKDRELEELRAQLMLPLEGVPPA